MRKVLLYVATLSLLVAGLISCGGNSSKINPDEVNQIENTENNYKISSETYNDRNLDSISTDLEQQLESKIAQVEADARAALDKAQEQEINIKLIPGKIKSKEIPGTAAWTIYMTLSVKNLSDSPVSGKDYYIAYKCRESNGYTDDSEEFETINLKAKGIDLGPNETGYIHLSRDYGDDFHSFKVKKK